MARFTTRVELHDAKTWEDYNKLHIAMEKEGFTRTIRTDNESYQLPTAEYNRDAALTKEEILESAKKAASTTGHKFAVLVTESNGRLWHNLTKA
jgi:hypothetical protein